MAKPKTLLQEQARIAANRLTKGAEDDGGSTWAPHFWAKEGYLAGHRAGSRLTKAKRDALSAAWAVTRSLDGLVHSQNLTVLREKLEAIDARNAKKVRK